MDRMLRNMEGKIFLRVTETIVKETEERMKTLKDDLVGTLFAMILQSIGQRGRSLLWTSCPQ
jgi:hypothetical protein